MNRPLSNARTAGRTSDAPPTEAGVPGPENPDYVAFFDALADGRLRLGQTLTQEELCEVLGISLSPLRVVTTLLEDEGLILIRRRLGIQIFYPDVKFVGGTFQLRELLEREGLRKFADSGDKRWVEHMLAEHARVMDVVRGCQEMPVFDRGVLELENSMHGSFVAAYGNALISSLYRRLMRKAHLIRLINVDAVGQRATLISLSEHLPIIEAVGARDPDAAIHALERHLRGNLHRILTH
jgi:DNA-binding GntR family transcriptional regulator